MECKVLQVIETGTEGGAANLIICEILLMHISEDVLTEDRKIDQKKVDLVARMGFDWYCRASGEALFKVPKPNQKLGIGVDSIPMAIRHSKVLTGNDLGILGNSEALPLKEEVDAYRSSELAKEIFSIPMSPEERQLAIHQAAQVLINQGNVAEAWKILLQH
jgi:hypothetical protein